MDDDSGYTRPAVDIVEEYGNDVLRAFDDSNWSFWHGVEDGARDPHTMEFEPQSGIFYSDTGDLIYGARPVDALEIHPNNRNSTTLAHEDSLGRLNASWIWEGGIMAVSAEQIYDGISHDVSRAYSEIIEDEQIEDFDPENIPCPKGREPVYRPESGGAAWPLGTFAVKEDFEHTELVNDLNRLYELSERVKSDAFEISR